MPFTDVFTGAPVAPSELSYNILLPILDLQLTWPSEGDESTTAARIMDITPIGPASVTFPSALQASPGWSTLITNRGSDLLTVNRYDGSTLTTVDPGISKYVYLFDNTTAAGGWYSTTFGAGTSSADASALEGFGTRAVGFALGQDHEVTEIAIDVTINDTDRARMYVATAGLNVNLPSALSTSMGFFFLLRNASSGTVTITTSGLDTVDGAASLSLAPDESCQVHRLADRWVTLGRGRSSEFLFTQLSKDISAGPTVTLTTGEAANRILVFTGLLTQDTEVIIPSVASEYVVNNQTTGSFSVTVKTALGTGQLVVQNNQYLLYCDGTNTYNVPSILPAGSILFTDGSVSAPSITFALDTNTGFYRIGSDQIGVSAGGSNIISFGGTGTVINYNSASEALRITQTGSGNALLVEDSANPDSSPFVIDSVGNVTIGATANLSASIPLTVFRASTNISWLEQATADSGGPSLYFVKSRGSSIGAVNIVSASDTLGSLTFTGTDGVNRIDGARIQAFVDGTPGVNDMPGRLVFYTTADGASTLTERMRISSAGVVTVTGTQIITANTATDALRITQTGAGNALLVEDSATTDATPFVITAAGQVVTGHTTVVVGGESLTPRIQQHFVGSSSEVALGQFDWSASTVAPSHQFNKSRGGAIGTHGIVSSGDTIGSVLFSASDGVGFIRAAQIRTEVDGTPGVNDMPGRLLFLTTADGASSPTERMRIDNAGNIYHAGNTRLGSLVAPTVALDVTGATMMTVSGGQNATISGTTTNASGFLNINGTAGQAAGIMANIGGTVAPTGTAQVIGLNLGTVLNPAGASMSNAYGAVFDLTLNNAIAPVNFQQVFSRLNLGASSGGTISNFYGFLANTPNVTVGSTTTVVNYHGFSAANTGMTHTFAAGFRGVISSGTGRWNLYMDGTADNFFQGALGVGFSPAAIGAKLNVGGNSVPGASGNGLLCHQTIQSDVLTSYNCYGAFPSTVAAAFTLLSLRHFHAVQGTFGAGSAVTDQIGFLVNANMVGGANNYGFRGQIPSGANRWNLYMDGTANNAIAGNVRIGSTVAPTVALDVTGTISASTRINVGSPATSESLNVGGSIAVTGFVRSSSATLSSGYTTGAGGAVVQATDKTTAVTLDTVTGRITTAATALAANTTVSFTLNNGAIGATSNVIIHRSSGGTNGAYQVWVDATTGGAATICIRNTTGGSLSEALVLQFSVISGAVS